MLLLIILQIPLFGGGGGYYGLSATTPLIRRSSIPGTPPQAAGVVAGLRE
jgi:hypothetical protein